jgi:hypothetical protein
MTDDQAVQLLDLLCSYFEEYGSGLPHPRECPVADITEDLIDSLSPALIPEELKSRIQTQALAGDTLSLSKWLGRGRG